MFSLRHAERLVVPYQSAFAWSPDGEFLATLGFVGVIHIWDVTSGERKASLKGCAVGMSWIAWSPDAKHIAAGTDRGAVVIWEVESGMRVRSLRGRGGVVSLIDWSPHERRLASTEGDATIWIWDWRIGHLSSVIFLILHPMK